MRVITGSDKIPTSFKKMYRNYITTTDKSVVEILLIWELPQSH